MTDYKKVSEQVRTQAKMLPEQRADQMAKQYKTLNDIAPTISQHMQILHNNAVNYLHSKLPQVVYSFPGEEEREPSKTAQEQFLQHYEIANDPVKVLEHVKHGTLNNAHIETLQAIYPALYNEMQQKVMENATPKALKDLDYHKKLAVAKFLGQPMEQNMVGGIVGTDQAVYNQQQQQPQAAPSTPRRGSRSSSTLGGLKQLKVAQREATQTTELEEEND